jgi:hypothetical protein
VIAALGADGVRVYGDLEDGRRLQPIPAAEWSRLEVVYEEHLLMGHGDRRCALRVGWLSGSVIEGQQRQHSQKPDRAAEIIEHYHPNARKLELFARQNRHGWDAWGYEVGPLDNGPVVTRRWPSQGHPPPQGQIESSEADA